MDISKFCVPPTTTVNNAVKQIDVTGKKVVFVIDEDERLIGIFTDGDMRRYMLANGDFSAPVTAAMNPKPLYFSQRDISGVRKYVEKNKIIVLPIVDDDMRLVSAYFWNDADGLNHVHSFPVDVPIVIMAGGKGTRLYPYTKILPKPLIPIGDIPITEHIINRFYKYGARSFYMIVNHKKNMVKAYYNDLEKDYRLELIEEEQFLGTGGGLSLLKGKIESTFFLSNCDILIDADYLSMYKYHKKKKNKLTIVCARKNFVVPYGVINLAASGDIDSFEEKPEFSFLTNTGVYLIEPSVVNDLQDGEYIDLPDIAKRYMAAGEKVGVYPITEKSWMDMGQLDEMESMMKELNLE